MRFSFAMLILAIVTAFAVPACHGPTPVAISDLEVCAKLDSGKLKTEAAQLLVIATTAGFAAAGVQAAIDVAIEGAGIVGCAFAMVAQQYLSAPHSDAERKVAHDAMEQFRAKVSAPGHLKTFVQADGTRL
jgi:hypothetical protein